MTALQLVADLQGHTDRVGARARARAWDASMGRGWQRGHVRARRHEPNRIVPQTDSEQASLWVRGHRHHGS